MMSNYREERIIRLLDELKYETTRGMMEREINETFTYRFIVPVSQSLHDGVVACEFRTRPVHHVDVIRWADPPASSPALKVVK